MLGASGPGGASSATGGRSPRTSSSRKKQTTRGRSSAWSSRSRQRARRSSRDLEQASPLDHHFRVSFRRGDRVLPLRQQKDFDHALYCQTTGGETLPMTEWAESSQLAAQFVNVDKTEGIVDGESHVRRRTIRGKRKNEDILI